MSEAATIFILGIFSALILFLGWRRGFFHSGFKEWAIPIRLMHLIGAFAIYFFLSSAISSFFLFFYKKHNLINVLSYLSWLNFFLSFLIFCCLAIYLKLLPENVRRGILRRSSEEHFFVEDVQAAAFAWVMAFPLVLFIGQALEGLMTAIFKIPAFPDQIAVKFLKSTFHEPVYLMLATLSIVLFAPLIEEILFRGFLQSFIRQHLDSKQAILITSICFALFHYSSSQGWGNISIIVSLFVLSLFLGYIYEKQGSIAAPMLLHSGFNTISVINLYFFGGLTTNL